MKCLDQAQVLKYKPAGTRVEIQTDDDTSKREREMFDKNNNTNCSAKLAVKFPVSLTIDERACDPSSEIIGLSAQVQVASDDLSSSSYFDLFKRVCSVSSFFSAVLYLMQCKRTFVRCTGIILSRLKIKIMQITRFVRCKNKFLSGECFIVIRLMYVLLKVVCTDILIENIIIYSDV